MIVVAPNTVVSRQVYEWIAGAKVEQGGDKTDPAHYRHGKLALFSNVKDGLPLSRPPTILIDSTQLDSPEPLSKDFMEVAQQEIEAFRAEYRRANPGADADALTEKDILREVMNTVGKSGKLGAGVRCVVSVAMLTEGWDANNVSHILGIRAFGSQLLCEQVVGRGLRRRSWAINSQGHLEPEYANIYGIPFAFIPSSSKVPPEPPRTPAEHVCALEARAPLAMTFPRVVGYRLEIPDADYVLDDSDIKPFEIGAPNVPRRTETAGVVGKVEMDDLSYAYGRNLNIRHQQIGYDLAMRLINTHLRTGGNEAGDRRPWLFPKLARICTRFVAHHVRVAEGHDFNELRLAEVQADLADHIFKYLSRQDDNRRERLRPILRAFDPVGSSASVDFWTRKVVIAATKSHVSHVVLDGPKGNSWEERCAGICESLDDVAAFVKNDHLGFSIPYIHKGRSHHYVPDFLLRLRQPEGDLPRTLIVEISGGQKRSHSPGPTKIKGDTARDSWCTAVNNHGGFGRWAYIELRDPDTFRERIVEAIQKMYGDEPIIGDPELLDIQAGEQDEV
jgi:type III restriction enzyme